MNGLFQCPRKSCSRIFTITKIYKFIQNSIYLFSDFMGMKFFGWLLRNSGAFYIRRSFGDDMLYWAVFTEYVQSQLVNGDHPIEFYVEGTRSRTSKSYAPKFGRLYVTFLPKCQFVF